MDRTDHLRRPMLEALLRVLHRLPITARCGLVRNVVDTFPNKLLRYVMCQRGEFQLSIFPSFRCYAF
jgi:hypothetical protein